MTPIFAQEQLSGLSATFWKDFCIALIVLLGVAFAVVSIWAMTRKRSPVKIDDQPAPEFRKAAKRYNHDLSEQRYTDHERRIAELENWRNGLIEKLDTDKDEILRAGETQKDILQKQINELPGKIVADILNTRKLFSNL